MSAAESIAPPQLKPRVLVCDDSSTIRNVVAELLGPTCECLLVASAEEALERVEGFAPDLVLTDVLMDGMNGVELCRRLGAMEPMRHVPVVLLTTMTDEEARASGLEAGAAD